MANYTAKLVTLIHAADGFKDLEAWKTDKGHYFVGGVHGLTNGRMAIEGVSGELCIFEPWQARAFLEMRFDCDLPEKLVIACCHPMAVKRRGGQSLKAQGITILGDWECETMATCHQYRLVVRPAIEADYRYFAPPKKVSMPKALARRWAKAQQYKEKELVRKGAGLWVVPSTHGGSYRVTVHLNVEMRLDRAYCTCEDYGTVTYNGVPVCKHVLAAAKFEGTGRMCGLW